MRRHLWGIGLGVALCCGAAWAQDTGTKQAQREGKQVGAISEEKLAFIQQVAFLDQTQIALGKLALEKSTDPGIRAYAQSLIQQHQEHLRSLQTYAEANTLSLALLDLGAADRAIGGSGPASGAAGEEVPPMDYDDKYLKKVNEFSLRRSELAQLTGKAFDKGFLLLAMKYQKDGEKLVNKGMKKFDDDTTFTLLLDQLVPVLQSHRSQAQAMEQAIEQAIDKKR
jgi:putative membrane protein